MIKIVYVMFFLGPLIWGQSAFHNAGNIQVHGDTKIGFHTNWINNADFADGNGLVGFYGDGLELTGSTIPTLNDIEVFVTNDLFLNTTLKVTNNLNFIGGDISSPLNNQMIYLNFEEEAFYTGEEDASKITGFAVIEDKRTFSFPVGDEEQLRPLLINSDATNDLAICAYLFENPSNPTSIAESFDIDTKVNDIGEISNTEFWILQTDVPSSVTLSWNQRSGLGNLANSIEDVILVGWSKSNNQWVAIGNSGFSGDLEQGSLVSEKFIPNEFAAITFGTIPLPTDTFAVNNPTLGNYFVSPNNDDTNDFLVFDNLEQLGENVVFIYNKFGQKVFEMQNYTNQFNGVSNIDNFVLNRDIGLPEGVYYYIIDAIEEELQYQGFFFLDR